MHGFANKTSKRPPEENVQFHEQMIPHLAPLLGFCKSLVRDRWNAEDLVQETLLKAFVAYRLNGVVPSKSYLFKIAQNAHIDHFRRRRLTTLPLHEYDGEAPATVDPMELRDAVTELVRRLPLRQQCIYLLREVFQLTAAEISERTNISEGAVKALLHRARTTLQRQTLDDDNTAMSGDRVHEDNTVTAYLAAIASEDPELFLRLLVRVQMEADVHVEAQQAASRIVRARVHASSSHAPSTQMALAA